MLLTTVSFLVLGLPIRTCAPPPNMCTLLEGHCLEAGVDPGRCAELASFVCPGGRCLACDRATTECNAAGLDCSTLEAFCDKGLTACNCEPKCGPSHQLSLPALFAVCWSWAWNMGDFCVDESVGQCFAVLGWKGCDLPVCEYIACQEDIEAQGQVCAEPPPSCDSTLACGLAEEG